MACASLAQFLTFVGAHPEPDKVARALTLGPLGGLEANSGLIALAMTEAELHVVGAYGFPQEALDRYRVMPTSVDLPLTRAFRTGDVVVVPAPELTAQYPVLSIDEEMLDTSARTPEGLVHVVSCPVVSEGVTCGVFGFVIDHEPHWGQVERSLLSGLSSAIGLWATHQATDLLRPTRAESSDSPLLLRPRQIQILELVEIGKSNGAIASILGFSESTIKQEIQRMNRIFRSSDRLTTAQRARELGLLTPAE